ncbi:glycoside hydrolase family 2 protein [Microvirga brassicacearum]|uniref:Glycoside hydrolase family 2 n=1 Tax=Microvirga brassicacearum TaxID=2580413 RepID=A0A5N3P6S3_9HYPH|nr:sugar-binding domain-containing protein [Microvirga brassicacearum]KAB0265434.1 glycoside hydrolase family 2 [Microvirga brassicacearum]
MDDNCISLDGEWEFLHVADDRLTGPAEVRQIVVPSPWQAQFHDLRMRAGIGIYRRSIDIDADWLGDTVWIRFGAVFHNARVFINDQAVGSNEGGFLPFSFDVTEYLRPGKNEIKVRVDSPTDNPAEFPDSPFAEIPFGKQSWYGPLSGIWQPVYLERRVADHMTRIRLVPNRDTGQVSSGVFFARPMTQESRIRVEVRDPSGSVVVEEWHEARIGITSMPFAFRVADVVSWSPQEPNRYRVLVEIVRDDKVQDAISDHFGFRTIEIRNGHFYLNGKPFYLLGALDQDYYPDTICTVPSVEFLEDQFRKAKELGLNCLRCHIKAADPLYYEVADRMGMLIWTELPNGGMSTERSRGRKEKLLKGIIDRDCNHPSIIIWTIINENWGVDLVHDPDHREWLKRTFAWLKAYDPTRLVVDNSPLAPSFHVESDIADYHFYAAIPDHRDEWDTFVDELASRASWLYSPYGDAVITGREPIMCSEFGNWGLPYPKDLRNKTGEEPWWFETGHDWGEGVMYAHGVENRFADWSMDRVFGDLRRFVMAAQWQQFRALKYQIEAMRRKPNLAGYVITELHDCHWESNGLLDMRRNPRVFHELFHIINGNTVIVPKWKRVTYWAGETIQLELAVAHGAGPALENCQLSICLGDETLRVSLPARVEAPTVVDLGSIELPVPDLSEADLRRIAFELRDADGQLVAQNHLDLAIHPLRNAPAQDGQLMWAEDDDIRERLEAMGYGMARAMSEANVIVARNHDKAVVDHVRQGASLLLLPENEISLYPFFPHWQNVRVKSRDGTLWRGDWASSFAWLRRVDQFARIPSGPLLDETMDRVLPDFVIAGCNLLDFQARVFAGLVVGWIHKPVALGVERTYGRGRIVASTFRLFEDVPLADPTATMLLDSLIELAVESRAQRLEEAVRAAEAAA